jgi:hypothetical protein
MSSGPPGTAPRTGTTSIPLENPAEYVSPPQPRLRQGHEAIEATLPSARRRKSGVGADDDDDEEEEEDHVELQFTVPGVNGATENEQGASPKMWNVSPAVLPAATTTTTSSGGGASDGAAEQEEEMEINKETTTPAPAVDNDDNDVEAEETTGRATPGRSRRTTTAKKESEVTEPKTRQKRKA